MIPKQVRQMSLSVRALFAMAARVGQTQICVVIFVTSCQRREITRFHRDEGRRTLIFSLCHDLEDWESPSSHHEADVGRPEIERHVYELRGTQLLIFDQMHVSLTVLRSDSFMMAILS